MKINTRDFGEVDIDMEQTILFKQAIYGFDKLTRYVILTDKEVGEHFAWLQAVDDPDTCFILVDPTVTVVGYHPQLSQEMSVLLEVQNEQDLLVWTIAVIPENFQKTTHNLRSPIVINTVNRYAAQIMLDEEYPIRALLFSQEERN